jgi:predicted pyridoxine 5'-phosphate oxidase superfamily flavin-nucleotide-binding protein
VTDHPLYHDGTRRLQDRFDSRRIADRLEQVTVHTEFTEKNRDLIQKSAMFFMATVSPDGQPDVSYKGGMPGFVRIVDSHTLAWPDYDGNGMFRTLGNALITPRVSLLFVDFDLPRRLRLHGIASVSFDDPLMAEMPGAQLVVRFDADRMFSNCPRYIHRMNVVEYSAYVPRPDHELPTPAWKEDPNFRDHLPKRG